MKRFVAATALSLVVHFSAGDADAAMLWELDFDTFDVYAYGSITLAGINGSSLDQVKSFDLYVSPGGYFGFNLTKDDLSHASWSIDTNLYAFFNLFLAVPTFEHEPGLFITMHIDDWSYPQDLHTIVVCDDKVSLRCGGKAYEHFVGLGESTFVRQVPAPAPASALLLVTGLAIIRRRWGQAQRSNNGTR